MFNGQCMVSEQNIILKNYLKAVLEFVILPIPQYFLMAKSINGLLLYQKSREFYSHFLLIKLIILKVLKSRLKKRI